MIPGARVRGVTLAKAGSLEDALASSRAAPIVYPMFMSDGWFTSTELPRRLGGAVEKILPPLGLDPLLPELVADDIAATCRARDWARGDLQLVVAAHGSGRSDKAALAARRFADRIQELCRPAAIRVGFVEQDPTITSAAAGIGPQSICIPFFATGGGHVRDDIPAQLGDAGFSGIVSAPVGAIEGIEALIARRIAAATPDPGSKRV